MASPSGVHHYRRYVIRTAASGGMVSARAFIGRKPVELAEGASVEEVLAGIRAMLDARERRLATARADGIPTAEEFGDAFALLDERIGQRHWQMLHAMRNAPARTLTANGLAAAAGYPSYNAANMQFGKLARLFAEELGYDPPKRANGTPIWTLMLATEVKENRAEPDRTWRWQMRKQVADCLAQIGG